MSDLLSSLKADLLDRRMLPLLALLGVALVAAVAYAVLSGGGASSTPSASVAPVNPAPVGPLLPVTQAPANPHAAVAETTEGGRYQHRSGAHNPFTPLVKPASASAAASSAGGSSSSQSAGASSSTGSGTSGSSGSSGAGAGGATPEKPAEPTPSKPQPHKPKTVYVVDVLYGVAPTVPGQVSQLTPFAGLKRMQPLPSAQAPRIVYAGVSSSGKDALFTLAGEAILKGQGTCKPSATQCEALALAQGQSEEFDYLEENGQSVVYELEVVSISKHQASAAKAARVNRLDRAGKQLMRQLALPFLHHLRFSWSRGVLVYAARHHHHG